MRLMFHIGTEKTGSSYLQTLCGLNRKYLQSNEVWFPKAGKREKDLISGRISPGNAADLSKAIYQKKWSIVLDILKHHLNDAIDKDCQTLLLSNETLVNVLSSSGTVERFVQQCNSAGFDEPIFLLFLRDPVDQALSLYKHRSKRGTTPDIEEWLKSGYSLPQDLLGFLDQVDQSKIMVKRYDKEGDYMRTVFFNDWLGVDPPKDRKIREVNPSLTLSELIVLKQIRKKDPGLTDLFYEKMLAIPSNEKSNDRFLNRYYLDVIWNFQIKYNEEWKVCNDHLSENQKLEIPYKSKEIAQNDYFLSFSSNQTEAWIQLQNKSNSFTFQCRLLYKYTIRPFLSKIKSLITR